MVILGDSLVETHRLVVLLGDYYTPAVTKIGVA
jgi:hypothetical protein